MEKSAIERAVPPLGATELRAGWFKTTRVVLTAGAATGGTTLNAFDNALRKAGIADFNLIKVTSIVPPGVPVCHLRTSEGSSVAGEGLMLPAVYETLSSDKAGVEISAGVAVGMPPSNIRGAGLIFAYSCEGSKEQVEQVLRAMVEEGVGVKGYPDYRFESSSVSAITSKPWTCVFAAAAFCDPKIEQLLSLELTS